MQEKWHEQNQWDLYLLDVNSLVEGKDIKNFINRKTDISLEINFLSGTLLTAFHVPFYLALMKPKKGGIICLLQKRMPTKPG